MISPRNSDVHDDIVYPSAIPFVLMHVACFAAIWTGITPTAVAICIVLYVVRMFGLTAGYHRYFSHRTYKTSRLGQFCLGWLCQTSTQRGILWWAAIHRHHHKYSDLPNDVHSPRHHGFWYSHMGWIFSRRHDNTDFAAVTDFTKYPELLWLNRNEFLPPMLLALAIFFVAGWPGVVVGFFWSTVILYHCTFMINSMAHVVGKRRYLTGDDSRNNWLLALITLGEGWHNNHHAYQSSTRQGFRWWEVDPTYYVLKALSWLGIVWDLRAPPKALVRGEYQPARSVTEKVARQLASYFPLERITAQARESLAHRLDELRERASTSRAQAAAWFADLHMPHVPTVDEIRQRAREHFAHTPSLDEIAERARELILEAVFVELVPVGAVGR